MNKIALFLLVSAGPLVAKPEIVTLKPRPNVSFSFLLDQPQQFRKGTLVLFVGGNGSGAFTHREGKVALGDNFLARSLPRFVTRGYAVALLGVPSDLPNGYSDSFRTSVQHQKDITAVAEYLVERGLKSLYFVGTSRGTLSAAWLASKMDPIYLKGLVLTSSVTALLEPALTKTIVQPVLMIHHTDDPCKTARYDNALKVKNTFVQSRRFGFVGVTGGTRQEPGARECSSRTPHGFTGKEGPVADTMMDWIEGKEPRPKI